MLFRSKKEKYYSERFVSLSKLVMKGVAIIGRGLVTLHQRGEELSAAPMQIDDLISVGSYHFRKSYMGVVQFSARHPEIGERLLVNQLGWSTTLLRLYKTKEKLNTKAETTGNKKNEEIRMKNEEERTTDRRSLPTGSDSSFLPLHSSSDNGSSSDKNSALGAVSALFEPGAFSAVRPYSAFDSNQKIADSKPQTEKKSLPRETDTAAVNSQTLYGADGPDVKEIGNNAPGNKKTRTMENQNDNETGNNRGTASEQKIPIKNSEGQDIEERNNNEPVSIQKKQIENPDETKLSGNKMESQKTELIGKNGERDSDVTEIRKTEREKAEPIGDPGEPDPDGKSCDSMESDRMDPVDQSESEEPNERGDDPPPDNGIPGYLMILQNAFGRSGPSETGKLTFTFDEIVYLAADPDFSQVYPESAEEMRRILDSIDSG